MNAALKADSSGCVMKLASLCSNGSLILLIHQDHFCHIKLFAAVFAFAFLFAKAPSRSYFLVFVYINVINRQKLKKCNKDIGMF